MIDLLAAVILLLLLIAIWIWAAREVEHATGLAVLSAVASSLIIGVTILGLLGLIDDPYCLRCS